MFLKEIDLDTMHCMHCDAFALSFDLICMFLSFSRKMRSLVFALVLVLLVASGESAPDLYSKEETSVKSLKPQVIKFIIPMRALSFV